MLSPRPPRRRIVAAGRSRKDCTATHARQLIDGELEFQTLIITALEALVRGGTHRAVAALARSRLPFTTSSPSENGSARLLCEV